MHKKLDNEDGVNMFRKFYVDALYRQPFLLNQQKRY